MEDRRKGQGLVEFAMIFPILLLVLLGITEAALVVQGYMAVQHAAREAARFATTYQPPQGACLDLDGDGVFEDGINDDEDGGDSDDQKPWPLCPVDYDADVNESDADYYARRVELIKRRAREAAVGLRIDEIHLGDTPGDFQAYESEPGFFGVGIWGFPSFQTDCNAYDSWDSDNPCLEHPGLEGLPVRVYIKHNVEIVDPLYRQVVEHVPVEAEAQMINEGIQVGVGDVPPPHFQTDPDLNEPTVVPTEVPTVTATSTDVPESTTIVLSPGSATNVLPYSPTHKFVATVTDASSQPVVGAPIGFSIGDTDVGGFDDSGTSKYTEGTTNAQGEVSVTVYGHYTGTATIRAWIDNDGNDEWSGDSSEPSDTANKTWEAYPPYIFASDYDVFAEDLIDVDMLEHEANTTYQLLWCVISGTTTSKVTPVTMDDNGNETLTDYLIPENSSGLYRLETHSGGTECGEGSGDLMARSAEIQVRVARPDLSISFIEPITACPESEFTVSAVIQNHTPGSTDQTFDVDMYVDKGSPEGGILPKQWVDGIGPNESITLTTVAWVGSAGEHDIQATVDTSDYVEEEEDWENWDQLSFSTGGFSTIKTANFDGGTDGFTYVDDAFDTNEPDYAQGDHSSGALRVEVGAISGGGEDIYDMSGGWRWNFNLDAEKSLRITFDYNLIQTSAYEPEEYSQVMVDVDGTLYGDNCSYRNCVAEIGGGGQTGWQTFEVTVGPLSAGDHTLTIGGYNNLKTYGDEHTTVWIDEVTIDEDLCGEGSDPPPWGEGPCQPPGSRECESLLEVGGFEGNPETVFQHWHAGGVNAYQRQSLYFYEGTVSMRLHASLGSYPACPSLDPYLYQSVTIPDLTGGCTDTMTTTLVVRGQRLIADSLAPCSVPRSVDADDELYVQLRNAPGDPSHLITSGAPDMASLVPEAYKPPWAIPLSYQAGLGEGNGDLSSVKRGLMASLLAPLSAPPVNFNDHTITSYSDQDVNPTAVTIEDSGATLHLEGNTWKKIDYVYTVTPDTVLEFDFRSEEEGEIHGIGLDDNNSHAESSTFRVYGTQNWGRGDFDNYSGSDWEHYAIPIGQYYTGDMSYLFFVNDEDVSSPTADSRFSNIRLHEPPTLGFSSTDYSVNEDGGTATISVTLSAASDQEVTVDYATSDGTATAGEDYVATSGTLTFVPDDTLETFTVDITDDIFYDSSETVMLELSNATNAVVEDGSATLTIVENDPRPLMNCPIEDDFNDGTFDSQWNTTTIGDASGSVNESGGLLTIDARGSSIWGNSDDFYYVHQSFTGDFSALLRVWDGLDTDQWAKIGLMVRNSTADNSRHVMAMYTRDHGLQFGYRTTDGGTTDRAVDDVSMSTPVWVRIVRSGSTFDYYHSTAAFPGEDDWTHHSSVTVNMNDTVQIGIAHASYSSQNSEGAVDDILVCHPVAVDFSSADYSVAEDGGSATITVTLEALAGAPVMVDYTSSDGTATAGADYGPVSGTLTFDGVTVITFTVPISDDVFFEGDETVTLDLSNARNARVGPNDPATLTIIEDETEPSTVVSFGSEDYTVHEDGGSAVISVTLSAAFTDTITVTYGTQDDTAVAPDDYADTSGQLVFDPGTTVLTFTVPISDDMAFEGDESLILELSDAINATIGTNPATLTIIDDEPMAPEIWESFSVDFGGDVDVVDLAEQEVEVRFYATHDGDPYGTWFYLDDLEAEVCTEWPVPDEEPGMATIYGTVKVEDVPRGGVDVWAYSQDTDATYHTVTLGGGDDLFPKGTYHFYNIPPGAYTVYSEAWEGGLLFWDTKDATVSAGGQQQVDLNLQW